MLVYDDPLFKAAECERVIAIIADPERRLVLRSLRDFWIALGDGLPCDSPHDETDPCSTVPLTRMRFSMVSEIHTQLMADYRNAMH